MWQSSFAVKNYLILLDHDKQGFEKGCALIQANLGIDPTTGTYEDWAENYAKAIWLERWRDKKKGELPARLFGGEK